MLPPSAKERTCPLGALDRRGTGARLFIEMLLALAVLLGCAGGLAEQTREAWIEIYTSWLELPDGNALPVEPGPAFCVGRDGFAVVDQNAVAGSVHLFATIRGRGPYAARARGLDPKAGIAAIQLHPDALAGIECLVPAPDDAAPLREGDVLYAAGPRGAEPVALRVKRATAEAIAFHDALPETILAGSPLVDGAGALRGVLVAGAHGGKIGREHATGALAGLAARRHANVAIPLAAAMTLIVQVRKQQADGMPSPPRVPVVSASENVFPRALRRSTGLTPEDLQLFAATKGDATVEFLTPPSVEMRHALTGFSYAPGKSFFRWTAHTQMWEPMVAVQEAPKFEWTAGSNAAAVFMVIFAMPIALGGGNPTFTASYTFPRSRASISIERGGVRIAAADAFLDCFEDAMPVEKEPGHDVFRKVRGCRAFYLFHPGAFAPGADVTVRIEDASKGTSVDVPVRPETQARIAADFAPWEAALHEGAETIASPSAVIRPPPPPGVPYATRSLGNAELRLTTAAGYTTVATLVQGSDPVIRIPFVCVKLGLSPLVAPGFVCGRRDTISFEPSAGGAAAKQGFTVPRAETAVTTTSWPRLHVRVHGKTRKLNPVVTPPQGSPSTYAFDPARKEAGILAAQFATALLGDFDRAVAAFERPEILGKFEIPPEEPRQGGDADSPDP
jgi:hypothetical protein